MNTCMWWQSLDHANEKIPFIPSQMKGFNDLNEKKKKKNNQIFINFTRMYKHCNSNVSNDI